MEAIVIGSALFSAAGSLAQGNALQGQYMAASKANEHNAAILRQRSETTLAGYDAREEQHRRTSRLESGKRIAAIGQSGTGFGGSNADMERQSAVLSEMDALNIRYEGALESHGLLAQADVEDWNAGMNRRYGRDARNLSYLQAAGNVLTGAGNYMKVK